VADVTAETPTVGHGWRVRTDGGHEPDDRRERPAAAGSVDRDEDGGSESGPETETGTGSGGEFGAVVGVGNPTMRDDGLGRAVVRRLQSRVDTGVDADRFEATFAGTTAFFALEAMSGADRAVVVDAVSESAPPGTVYRFRLDRRDSPAPEVTMHDVTFLDAVQSCATAYDLPERVALVGVVPATVAAGVGLTPAVEAATEVAVHAVRAELGHRPRYGSSDRTGRPCGDDATDRRTTASESADGDPQRGDTLVDATWYCRTCDRRIEAEAVDDHEAAGHSVKGRLRPERLLAQDPWETSDDPDGRPESTDRGGDG
jgi:hydrogenase maturation protease